MTEEWSLSLVVFEAPLADLGLLAFSKTLTQTGGGVYLCSDAHAAWHIHAEDQQRVLQVLVVILAVVQQIKFIAALTIRTTDPPCGHSRVCSVSTATEVAHPQLENTNSTNPDRWGNSREVKVRRGWGWRLEQLTLFCMVVRLDQAALHFPQNTGLW